MGGESYFLSRMPLLPHWHTFRQLDVENSLKDRDKVKSHIIGEVLRQAAQFQSGYDKQAKQRIEQNPNQLND